MRLIQDERVRLCLGVMGGITQLCQESSQYLVGWSPSLYRTCLRCVFRVWTVVVYAPTLLYSTYIYQPIEKCHLASVILQSIHQLRCEMTPQTIVSPHRSDIGILTILFFNAHLSGTYCSLGLLVESM